MTRLSILFATLLLAFAAACGDDDGNGGGTPAPTGAGATAPIATATLRPPLETVESTELGEAPVFLRTLDNFATLTAGTEYKIVVRVTNGYAEPELRIVAEPAEGGEQLEFVASMAEVGDTEGAGSFYPVNILLPEPGAWVLTVLAGEDEVSVEAFAQPAS